ncbi:PAS domain-containing protein [Massilia sp. GCM10020059]|uniref:histidine kinase n=1 Tax=Massilia agrisoli TaxID=2892444 RepID=A0ABS8IRX0_9BURK|nr:PAS domain-containing protein [Massilia agrisoli]MCC6070030.1 PAS domain-containing protein [Massilia agrisoli]
MVSDPTSGAAPEPDYRALFAAVPVPLMVLAPDFTIVAVNEPFIKVSLAERADMVGRNVFDVFPDNPDDPQPAGSSKLRASLERVVRTREADTMAVQKYDVRVGDAFTERYWSVINIPLLDAGGALTHILHRSEDVTQFHGAAAREARMESRIEAQSREIEQANRRLRDANEELDVRVVARTEELRKEREYFQSLLMAVPVPVSVMHGPHHRFVLENDAHRAMSQQRDIIGKTYAEAFPDAAAALLPILDRIYATGEPFIADRHLVRFAIRPGGPQEDFIFSMSWHPLFGMDGHVEGIITATQNLTEQLRAEAREHEREARYRSLFESIDEGFCVIEMLYDDEGKPADYRFLETNNAFVENTGLADANGKTVRELAPMHEQHWFDIYGRVASTGEPIRFENEARALGRWYEVYAFRLGNPALHQVGILFKDVAERRRAEDELRNSERRALAAARDAQGERRRLDALLQAAPAGIVVTDADGKVLMTNAAHRRLWGDPGDGRQAVLRKGWWADGSARHGQPLAPHEWITARVLRGEEAPRDTVEIETSDTPPVRRIVLVTGAPIVDEHGAITGAVVTQMDITDRVRAEEALRQDDRRKDEFLAMLAHELRNPLSPIGAAADLLAMGRLDAARVRQTSAVISRQVKHMTGLVDDLLDVSRVTRGLITLESEKLDARRIVAEAVEQVRPLIDARRHQLTVHTPPEPAYVMGDQKRLTQVLANLLNNAAKYTPLDGSIVIAVELDGGYVRTRVTDNGIGMAPEVLARAFELFSQAERTSDRSQGGLGIGLALVKSLVELHGGTVSAHSDGIGAGSTFTLCLPRVAAQAPGRRDVPDTAQADPARVMKVMVVDDNTDAAEMLAMYVEALGHEVAVEYSSAKALALAQAVRPDVCLLDIGLPDMDGYELARRLRADDATASSVLVAVTGYGQEQDRSRTRAAGFDHHFVKPVNTAALAELLRKAAENRA